MRLGASQPHAGSALAYGLPVCRTPLSTGELHVGRSPGHGCVRFADRRCRLLNALPQNTLRHGRDAFWLLPPPIALPAVR
eukprot:7111135-Alexandrium_andersonii.AAC.1